MSALWGRSLDPPARNAIGVGRVFRPAAKEPYASSDLRPHGRCAPGLRGIRIRVVAGRTDETSFPRPDWMDKGVSYLDRGKRDVAPLFKKAGAATTNQDK